MNKGRRVYANCRSFLYVVIGAGLLANLTNAPVLSPLQSRQLLDNASALRFDRATNYGLDALESFSDFENAKGPHRPHSCFNDSHPSLILLKGERHSGTSLVCKLVVDNAVGVSCPTNYKYEWKHGFTFPIYHPLPAKPADSVLLVVTKNAFDWLPRMYKKTYGYMDKVKRNLTFSEFIRAPYREHCRAAAYNRKFRKVCQEPFEVADNIIHIRTLKYKNWLWMDPRWFGLESSLPYSSRSLMRYESLLEEGQEAVVARFLNRHCIPRKDGPFISVDGPVKWGHEGKKSIFVPPKPAEVLSMYSVDDIRFVLSQLDLEFESRILHYTYAYVEGYLHNISLQAVTSR